MKHSLNKKTGATANIPSFNDFLTEELMLAGFGPAVQIPNMAAGSIPTTGYSMKPMAYHMDQISTIAAREAKLYEGDDDPNHKGDDYIEEAKKAVCGKIDERHKGKANGDT